MITYFATISSAVMIRPDSVAYPERERGTALANEPFAFQIAMRSDDARFCPVSVQVTGAIPMRAYREEYIPVTQTMADTPGGLFPDPLSAREAAAWCRWPRWWTAPGAGWISACLSRRCARRM